MVTVTYYVCNAGSAQGKSKKRTFINNGDSTFSDKADDIT
jgi:hypothetical protein